MRALVAERILCKFPESKSDLLDPAITTAPASCEVGTIQGVSTASAEYQEGYAGDNYDQGDDG